MWYMIQCLRRRDRRARVFRHIHPLYMKRRRGLYQRGYKIILRGLPALPLVDRSMRGQRGFGMSFAVSKIFAALKRIESGKIMPAAFARSSTSHSSLCAPYSTGISLGFAPFSILSTIVADCAAERPKISE